MIIVFTLFHHVLEALYASFGGQLRDFMGQGELEDREVIFDCLRYLGEKGVGWVVRKLEEWNA